jgi:menaquinone-dependent protoporphyrinogen IX oxidase
MKQYKEVVRPRKILVAYATNAGSTEEVAQAVADGLRSPVEGGAFADGPTVDVRRVEEVTTLDGYEAVIIGAPMILGWSRAAVNFIRCHSTALESKKVAYFCTMMALTAEDAADRTQSAPAIFIDPDLPAAPKNPGRLSFKERYATVKNYLRPVLAAAPQVKPLSVAFIGGKLELFRLKWWQMVFVMVVIGAAPGDRRNFETIRAWGASLRQAIG